MVFKCHWPLFSLLRYPGSDVDGYGYYADGDMPYISNGRAQYEAGYALEEEEKEEEMGRGGGLYVNDER